MYDYDSTALAFRSNICDSVMVNVNSLSRGIGNDEELRRIGWRFYREDIKEHELVQ